MKKEILAVSFLAHFSHTEKEKGKVIPGRRRALSVRSREGTGLSTHAAPNPRAATSQVPRSALGLLVAELVVALRRMRRRGSGCATSQSAEMQE
jgi:hypothetical protein